MALHCTIFVSIPESCDAYSLLGKRYIRLKAQESRLLEDGPGSFASLGSWEDKNGRHSRRIFPLGRSFGVLPTSWG